MTQFTHHRHHKIKKTFQAVTFLLLLGILATVLWFNKGNLIANDNADKKEANAISAEVKSAPVKTRAKPYISITPEVVKQGDPVLITIEGATTTSSVESFTYDNRPLFTFLYEGQVVALLGVELRAIPGTYPLVVTFIDGRQLKENITISPRNVVREPFDIPDKLGGNTTEGEKQLVSSLAAEGTIINALPVVWDRLWTEKFGLPLKGPLVVSDEYGYTRLIGNYTTMPHKGTDIKAEMGTPVYAMNRGVVKFASSLRNYGNTVVIDHGAGLQTVYMHLSKINVTLEQKVEKGELIALSGDSGYTLGPHLHLTVRIWDISIDPMKFLELFGEN